MNDIEVLEETLAVLDEKMKVLEPSDFKGMMQILKLLYDLSDLENETRRKLIGSPRKSK